LFLTLTSSVNLVTSLFLVLSVLKTSNNLSIGSVFILFSFTSCLLISIWIHSESTNVFSHNFFLFDILIFVYILSFFYLLSLCWGITYQLRDLLCVEVCHTISTLNLWQNTLLCHYLHYLSPLVHSCSLSSTVL